MKLMEALIDIEIAATLMSGVSLSWIYLGICVPAPSGNVTGLCCSVSCCSCRCCYCWCCCCCRTCCSGLRGRSCSSIAVVSVVAVVAVVVVVVLVFSCDSVLLTVRVGIRSRKPHRQQLRQAQDRPQAYRRRHRKLELDQQVLAEPKGLLRLCPAG